MSETKVKNTGLWKSAWKRLKKNRLAMLGLVLLLLFTVTALLADQLAPFGYAEQHLKDVFRKPSAPYYLGTDNLGRDILSRIIYGARISLQVGFISVGIALLVGGTLGAVSGFYGGKVDNIIMRFVDILLAIPNILLAIVIASTLGTGLQNLMLAVGISSIPSYARIIRASILTIREQEFVEAARLSGCSDFRIIRRHLLPNILAPVIVQVTLGLGLAILNASSLSFLGLGIQAPVPEWGAMLASGRGYIRQHWHMVTFPGLAIAIVVLAFNMVGDGLRDALDPRMKG